VGSDLKIIITDFVNTTPVELLGVILNWGVFNKLKILYLVVLTCSAFALKY
jgi:hypothetical protein